MTAVTRILESGTRNLFGLAERLSSPRLSILIFHRVHAVPDPLFPEEMTAQRFRDLCRWVKASFNVMTLGQALRHLRAGTLPVRALTITFDDGYADNAEVAVPILREHGLEATFFIATGFLDGGRMFNDTVIECIRSAGREDIDLTEFGLGQRDMRTAANRRGIIDELLPKFKHLQLDARESALKSLLGLARHPSLASGLMMRSAQVQQIHRAGMEIGGHTANHPILRILSDTDAEREVLQGRHYLEQLVEAPVACFAYPNGRPSLDYAARDVALIRRLGFSGAVSTAPGVVKPGADHFQLPRFTPWDRSHAKWLARLALTRARGLSPRVV